MKLKTALALFTLIGTIGCVKVNIDDSVTNNGGGNTGTGSLQDQIISSKIITGTINENVELPKGKYILKGYVYVQNRASITFAPGTVVVSDSIQKGALIIDRNSKIFAEGTAAQPIVFTTGKSVSTRRPGDWGGIVLLGNAPTNRSTPPLMEGGINAYYGGTIAGDNSGVLKYVRIEFAGIAADPNSEINGLTFGGVGSGTTIENIQVSYGNDDAYEWFGGTVNCKYLVALATADDDYDFDFGYSGRIQFAVSLRDPEFVDAGDAGNGIECDNDGTGTTATPTTKPNLSNFTLLGPNNAPNTAVNHNFAQRWRRSTSFSFRNSILAGYQKGGFSIESDSTASYYYLSNSALFMNNIVHAVTAPYKSNSTIVTAAQMQAKAESQGCNTYTSATDVKLTDPFNLTNPNFLPIAGSPALSGADFTGMTGFTATTYRGAFGTTDWTAGWTNFKPKSATY